MLLEERKKVLALFLPAATPFYLGLFTSLKNAFSEHNFLVVGGCGFLEGEALHAFIATYNPIIFFEMNRCKDEVNAFPEKILHVCWLVDLTGRALTDIRGSELVCFFSSEWMHDYQPEAGVHVVWLPPASDPDNYFPIVCQKEFESVFVGHIPKPWSDQLLQRRICKNKNGTLLFDDILKKFETQWAVQDAIVNNDRYIEEVTNWLLTRKKEEILLDEKALRYDIGCRIIRKARREYFLDWLLEHEGIEPLGIFGGSNWELWPKYSRFYHRELEKPEAINHVFNQAKVVIHEGIGAHFRLFDAMLSGTPVVIRKSDQDHLFGGIGTMMTEGEEYIAVDVNHNKGVLTKLMHEPKILTQIASNARKKALANHTWFHRLSETVRKFDEFGR